MKITLFQKNIPIFLRTIVLLLGIALLVSSCEKSIEGIENYRVYDDKMLDELMVENELSSFLAIVAKAEYTGTIHAYGAYTLFAPTNDAVNSYLTTHNIGSIDALSVEDAETMVKYHLVKDTLPTTDFVDGRLAAPNFAKKYLITQFNGQNYVVDRHANIVHKDIRGANGVLHIVDKVLTAPEQTITDAVRALPDDYSLMKEIFEQSGAANVFAEVKEDNWFTFFIQDNQAFSNAGIESVDDLLVELRASTPAIEDRDTLLYNYITYHGINTRLYIVDLLYISSMQTMVPKQVITFKRDRDVILLNEFVQGQMVEAGVALDRHSPYSDLNCANGVIQKINGNIQIKNRTAYRIYWDVAEQPEIMALKNFRKAGANVNFNPGDLSEVTWGGRSPGAINYYCGSMPATISQFDEKHQYVYSDYLRFNLYSLTTQWVEFKTPVLIEGKYKVWLCYRRELELRLKSVFKQEGYDDQVMPYVFDFSHYMPNPDTNGEEAIEVEGWKRYNAKRYNSVVISHLLGIIDVQSTGRHTLRFESTTGGRGQQNGNWDMIQFIPIEEDQLWPKVDMKGNWIGPELQECEIFPESECVTEEPAAG